MDTAVLLITFNRPQYTAQVLAALKKAGVKRLYVFKDGPRPFNEDDKKASLVVERLVDSIDWPCNVKTNYMNNNLGCGWGPYSAISWAFKNEERLIILEDDVVPSTAFFGYMDYVLKKYRDDSRVNFVSGWCSSPGDDVFKEQDYTFTEYAPTLGWGTWKRVWDNFSLNEKYSLKPLFRKGGFTNQFATKEENAYQNTRYKIRKNPLGESFHSWDYQFYVYCRINGALGIVPSKSLIQYVGMEGTHHTDDSFFEVRATDDYAIVHEPAAVALDVGFEYRFFKSHFKPSFKQKLKRAVWCVWYAISKRPHF